MGSRRNEKSGVLFELREEIKRMRSRRRFMRITCLMVILKRTVLDGLMSW